MLPISKFLSDYNILSLMTAFAVSKAGSAFFNSLIDATFGVLVNKIVKGRNVVVDEESFSYKVGESVIYFFRLLFMILITYVLFSIAKSTIKIKSSS